MKMFWKGQKYNFFFSSTSKKWEADTKKKLGGRLVYIKLLSYSLITLGEKRKENREYLKKINERIRRYLVNSCWRPMEAHRSRTRPALYFPTSVEYSSALLNSAEGVGSSCLLNQEREWKENGYDKLYYNNLVFSFCISLLRRIITILR